MNKEDQQIQKEKVYYGKEMNCINKKYNAVFNLG